VNVATGEPTNLILSLNNAAFRTSRAADEINGRLMSKLGQRNRNVVARLAIARSLAVVDPPSPIPADEADEEGGVIKGVNLFGDELAPWVSLLVERSELPEPSTKELQDLVARHWRRGVHLLNDEWKECHDEFDRFILQLAGRGGLREGGGPLPVNFGPEGTFVPKAVPVTLTLGSPGIDVQTQQPVQWLLNGRGNSPHIAVMGTLGTGKTRLAMEMLRQARRQTGCPIILFDMAKGDLAADQDLIREIGAEVIRAPGAPVPLDVLYTPDTSGPEVTNAAMRFRESFQRVTANAPGGAQLDALRDAAQRALSGARPVRISDVRDRLREVYSEKRRRDDVVVATFNDLMSWNLFEPKFTPAQFFSRSWIIDVHEATETAQRLIVFLVLDALYTYLKLLPDSEMDAQKHRALRIILGIDEARKVLGYKQPSLVGLVRESRSKGGVITLISQSPDDFDAEDDNFLENIGLGICFRTNARARALTAMLGQPVDLGSLPNGVCVTRLVGGHGVTRIKAWE
jgi:DNA sulfur modification protein DndE